MLSSDLRLPWAGKCTLNERDAFFKPQNKTAHLLNLENLKYFS
jgi:hypothetical protein